MLQNEQKTIFVLPHLDDEFAFAPLMMKLGQIASKPITIIYCAERTKNSELIRKKRRAECFKSISLFGLANFNIIFLNDYFKVDDLLLHDSCEDIFLFLKKYCYEMQISEIITTSLEGGHPDHDTVALLINKLGNECVINTRFIPIYNNRKSFGVLPLSVFKPLQTQILFFKYFKFRYFCWFPSLLISLIYSSERSAFVKLFPFVILQIFTSRGIYYSNSIDFKSIDWSKSFTFNRYRSNPKLIKQRIDKIQ